MKRLFLAIFYFFPIYSLPAFSQEHSPLSGGADVSAKGFLYNLPGSLEEETVGVDREEQGRRILECAPGSSKCFEQFANGHQHPRNGARHGSGKFMIGVKKTSINEKQNTHLVTVKYRTDSCGCTAQVDPAKMDAKTVESAFEFFFLQYTDPEMLSRSGIETMTLETLKKHREPYLKASLAYLEKIKNHKLPPGPQWKKAREEALFNAVLDQRQELAALDYLVKNETSLLLQPLQGKQIPSKCREYAEMLKTDAGTAKLFDIILARCKDNAAPKSCFQEGGEDRKVKQKMKVEALTFGWSNCVDHAWRSEIEGQEYNKAIAELKKTSLVNEKCSCIEP